MAAHQSLGSNILGDIRAEADHSMLDVAFLKTADFLTLIETTDRIVVVGRRGTGKSALTYQLRRHWEGAKGNEVVTIAPQEEEMLGLRPVMEKYGNKVTRIRAAAKIAWKYALMMEVCRVLEHGYKTAPKVRNCPVISRHLKSWGETGTVLGKLRSKLRNVTDVSSSEEDRIADLPQKLELRDIAEELEVLLQEDKRQFIFLIDRLDEGYEPDTIGVGIIDGFIYGTSEIISEFKNIRANLFLRDNIYRAVALFDPDFSRNIEGQVLRLNWDTHQLMSLVCSRLRHAFKLEIENNYKLWNRCTANELQGEAGFKKCLQLTLYRPRDALALLNDTFYNAKKAGREQIVLEDLEKSAKDISASRLDDLHKEYEVVFPGISRATTIFANGGPELTINESSELINDLFANPEFTQAEKQQFEILSTPYEVLRSLYSVGFIGTHDKNSNAFTFCHDGKRPDKEFSGSDRILIHPCYWMALNLTKNTLNPDEAKEINDEYEIQVSSSTPEIRAARVGSIISELGKIDSGREGDLAFEDWCLKAIKIAFAGQLENIEHHPNKSATQRRDIVATNLGKTDFWKRVLQDYGTRQVIFEVKNYDELGPAEYRQMNSYLCNDYGRLGFIITRAPDHSLRAGKELEWFKETYFNHNKVVVKLTGKFLINILSKLRSPQKHSASEQQMNTLLDTYTRMYASGQPTPKEKKNSRT